MQFHPDSVEYARRCVLDVGWVWTTNLFVLSALVEHRGGQPFIYNKFHLSWKYGRLWIFKRIAISFVIIGLYLKRSVVIHSWLTFGRVNNWFGRYLYFILWNLMSMVFHQGWYFVSFRSGCYSWSVIYYFKESISNFWISNHSDLRKVASKYIYQQNLCWGWVCNILRNNPRC